MKYTLIDDGDMSSAITENYKFDGCADISVSWADVVADEGHSIDGTIQIYGTNTADVLGWTLLDTVPIATATNATDYYLLHNPVKFEYYKADYTKNNIASGTLNVILSKED